MVTFWYWQRAFVVWSTCSTASCSKPSLPRFPRRSWKRGLLVASRCRARISNTNLREKRLRMKHYISISRGRSSILSTSSHERESRNLLPTIALLFLLGEYQNYGPTTRPAVRRRRRVLEVPLPGPGALPG